MGLPRRRSGSTYSVGSLVNAGNGLDGLGIVSVVCSLASRSVSSCFDLTESKERAGIAQSLASIIS